jgi:hypothetical protein
MSGFAKSEVKFYLRTGLRYLTWDTVKIPEIRIHSYWKHLTKNDNFNFIEF